VDPVRSPSDTKKTNSTAASPNGRNKFITPETLSYYCNEAKREHRGVVVHGTMDTKNTPTTTPAGCSTGIVRIAQQKRATTTITTKKATPPFLHSIWKWNERMSMNTKSAPSRTRSAQQQLQRGGPFLVMTVIFLCIIFIGWMMLGLQLPLGRIVQHPPPNHVDRKSQDNNNSTQVDLMVVVVLGAPKLDDFTPGPDLRARLDYTIAWLQTVTTAPYYVLVTGGAWVHGYTLRGSCHA
jgi:hypothetical protein